MPLVMQLATLIHNFMSVIWLLVPMLDTYARSHFCIEPANNPDAGMTTGYVADTMFTMSAFPNDSVEIAFVVTPEPATPFVSEITTVAGVLIHYVV